MILIAQKPCSFGGKKFYVGDIIPDDLVINPENQAKMGVITIYKGDVIPKDEMRKDEGGARELIIPLRSFQNEAEVTIPIVAENGIQGLSVARESLLEAIRIMQMDVKDAEKVIENVEDENVLIILHACDSRKGIKNASEKRALTIAHPDDDETNGFENVEDQLNMEDLEESVGDA